MTNFEFFSEQVKMIATKHNVKANFDGIDDEMVVINGAYNAGMHQEVLALCKAVKISPKKVFACEYGIDIMLDGWFGTKGKHEYIN